ncbi:TIR domain-containing protein [Albimonas sp. CAU 1670]|uniref:TIR domain-containing protein n=1 Tax=Albimonas sp. CAU 1670 TaxID=3032599 RepID=UPI0023DBB226|nr:TIR domain-containing protein [Albimonas sp. CAU 1670]MDF2232260.1 TIR domain-containing protein [Albimonas sp. CAU 1670]
MDVFISWSGNPSKALAETFRTWLPSVIQACKPYFTPNDIEKGAKWNSEISAKLDSSDIGLIILTKTNIQSPWILFESGALSKSLESSRVCPILFGIEPSDVAGPLSHFQLTPFNRDEMRNLMHLLNNRLGEGKLAESVVNSVFEMWWPQLDSSVSKILSDSTERAKITKKDRRTERDLLEEVLSILRSRRNDAEHASIAHAALSDLVGYWQSASEQLDIGDIEGATQSLMELEAPIDHICRKSGYSTSDFRSSLKRSSHEINRLRNRIEAVKRRGAIPED